MFTLIVWTFGLYGGIKFAHLVTGAGLGFGRVEASWSTRIRAGEPRLLVGTLTVFALLAVYVTWWSDRFLEGHYAYATDCYSKMAASHHLPGTPKKFGSYEASRITTGYVRSAQIHGAQLGMRTDAIDRNLDQGRMAYARHFTRLATGTERLKITAWFGDLDRCLNGDGSPRGEIFSPA